MTRFSESGTARWWSGIAVGLALGGALALGVPRFAGEKPDAPRPAAGQSDIAIKTVQGSAIVIPSNSPLRSELVVQPVLEQRIGHSLTLPAVVEANPALVAKVIPPAPGRVLQLNVAVGDHVEKNQIVAVIESASPAESETSIAGAASTPTSGNQILKLRAPSAGSVADLATARGGFFDVPIQPLMTISLFDTVWVTAVVPEKDISSIIRGQPAEISFLAYPGEIFRGRVFFTSDTLDSDTRRMKVRIALANPRGRLKPGMFATVNLRTAEVSQLVIPTSALLMNNDSTTVFVETAPWVFERRSVETGYDANNSVVVNKGLTRGDRVIVSGGVLLND